jgi:hypothetical protein
LEEIFLTTVILGCLYMALRPAKPPARVCPPRRRRVEVPVSYHPEGPAEYDSYFDGPDVKLYRHEWEAEQRRVAQIDRLLDSLTPADSEAELFTFWERWWFDLQVHKKRPRE